jgi:exo-1,4-beta-D-glucosaminidase
VEPRGFQHQRILSERWLMRAGREVCALGEDVSRPGFHTADWLPASVPGTVLGALVEIGRYENLYTGTHLGAVPRVLFESPWWYRTEFSLSEAEAHKTVLLEFHGINYAANVWLNGHPVLTAKEARGAFRRFQCDVSGLVVWGGNALAVEVIPPRPGDFSLGFVDWNPPAPDGNMGLIRPVRLRFCDGVSIEDPFVQTALNVETLTEGDPKRDVSRLGKAPTGDTGPVGTRTQARLTVSADLVNHSYQAVWGVLDVRLEGVHLSREVYVGARSTKKVVLAAEQHPELCLANPRLWWPHDLGSPQLQVMDLRFMTGLQVSDLTSVRFGIREVADYRTPEGHRGFKINGRPVLIRGAGWTDDLLLADTPQTLEAELQYARHMNLNCIRCEGIWGKDQMLYDLCDEYGILVMAGWSCQWEHEQYLGKPVDERYGGVTAPEDIELVSRSWRDQLLALRNHPSILVWAVASDKLPAPALERKYQEIFRTCDPTRPYLASTGGVGSKQRIVCREELTSEVSGSSGVKMLGPYDHTPPVYWYTDTRRGGAYGFNTETCPGAVVPTLESIKKMIPPGHLWPMGESWDFHCGRNEFCTLDRYREALAKRYGAAGSVEEFARKAQTMNYELMRPMFEAFRVYHGQATGVIQWMLNAAWPKMYWQLYDWYLMPTGAFYGAKKACEPLQLIYHYGDNSIYFVEAAPHERSQIEGPGTGARLSADIQVYDIESKSGLATRLPLDAESGTPQKVFELPHLDRLSTAYFLSLRLREASGKELGGNFYWLSTKPDVLDYQAKVEPWEYYTPSKEYADLTMLNHLPPARIDVAYRVGTSGRKATVELTNRSGRIAFFLELLLTEEHTGERVVPVFWQDNYVSLLPNETRTVAVTFPARTQMPLLTVRGWNIEQVCRVSA